MNQWRSKKEQINELEQQLASLKTELEKIKEEYRNLEHRYQILKLQNERLLKMEAEHQSSKESLLRKRIILSHAVLLVPESIVIGDQMENCVIKIYRGNNLTVTDTAKLINCRLIGLNEYFEANKSKVGKHGTIEIKGVFLNSNRRKYAISTHERVVISPGARFMGNVRAESIVVTPSAKVKGRLVSRELLRQRQAEKKPQSSSDVLEVKVAEGM